MAAPLASRALLLALLTVVTVAPSCRAKDKADFWTGDVDASADAADGATPPLTADAAVHADVERMCDGRPVSFVALAKAANPGVVNIYTTVVIRDRPSRLYPYFPFVPREKIGQSLGTGFIVDADGLVLTNNHVVEGAAQIRVRTYDDREFAASVVGTDPKTDIALLRLDKASGITALPLADSDKLEVGEWVMAIGNPLGLTSSVTAGIVSAKGRSDVPIGGDVTYVDFIQTDASINPGNSGGPLLNLDGGVVGINTAISREGQGIGFAIPINMIKVIYPQLRKFGKVTRSWLGIYVGPVTDKIASSLGMARPVGAVIRRIVDGGPAKKAGLKSGDVIVKFNGEPIADINDLRWKSSVAGIGEEVPVTVNRGGANLDVKLVLTRSPYN